MIVAYGIQFCIAGSGKVDLLLTHQVMLNEASI